MEGKLNRKRRVEKDPTRRVTLKEERALGKRILEQDDDKAREELMRAHEDLVNSIAINTFEAIADDPSIVVELEDLKQAAHAGFVLAARKYDYRKGRFGEYARRYLERAMNKVIGESRSIPVTPARERDTKKVAEADAILLAELRRPPTIAELARKTGLTSNEIKDILRMRNIQFRSLDEPTGEGNGGTLHGSLADRTTLGSEQVAILRNELSQTKKNLEEFEQRVANAATPEELEVFRMFYGLSDATNTRKTLDEVAIARGESLRAIEKSVGRVWKKMGYRSNPLKEKNPLSQLLDRISILEETLSASE